MYNLNVNGPTGAGGSGLLSLPLPQGENSTTPRTPEIVNSLIAMTNPFESSYRAHAPRLASSPPGGSDTSTSSSGKRHVLVDYVLDINLGHACQTDPSRSVKTQCFQTLTSMFNYFTSKLMKTLFFLCY